MIAVEPTVRIRPAAEADLESILAIERLCFTNNFWDSHSFIAYDCIVAEISGEIVGFLVSRELVSNVEKNGEREILNLAVHPEWRRRQIAKTLLKQELALGGSFFLEVRESNVAAQNLYRALGFRTIAKRTSYYSDPIESAIVMQTKE